MAPSKYSTRIPTIMAERFDATTPVAQWPAGVDDCGEIPGVHLHMPPPMPPIPVATGDWILHDATGTVKGALSDAEFLAQYEKATGPSQ